MLISSEQIGEITPEKCEYEIVENLTRSTSLQGYSVEATYSPVSYTHLTLPTPPYV